MTMSTTRLAWRALHIFSAVIVVCGTASPAAAAVPTTNAFPLRSYGIAACHNNFGDPRGDHTHQGNDCYAPIGTPLVAVEAGTIIAVDNTDTYVCGSGVGDRAGISLWLSGDSGTAYFYAHNSRNEITSAGARVGRGQVIAYLGRSGNVCESAAHLHFEVRPNGRGTPAVDPYPYLTRWAANGGTWNLGLARNNSDGNLTWHLSLNGSTSWVVYRYGWNGDQAVTGDWNGDGKTDIGVARRNSDGNLTWHLSLNGSTSWVVYRYGWNTDQAVTGDWDLA